MGSLRRLTVGPLVAAAMAAILGNSADAAPSREVLPDTVTPTHYDLLLSPNAEALTFRATVAISVDVKSSVRDIVLNADGLHFDRVRIDGGSAATVEVDRRLARATLHADRLIDSGRHVVSNPTTIANAAAQAWQLPITVKSLTTGELQTKILGAPTRFALPSPVLVNAGQTTYARVLYSNDEIRALIGRMASLSPADQLGLLNDTLALGLAGYTRASDALAMVRSLPVDADPIVWQGAISVLQSLDEHFAARPGKVAYRRFALGVLHPLAQRLGYTARPGESGNVEILRTSLERAQGVFGDRAVIRWAKRTLAGHGASAADHRTALRVVAGQADATTFNSLLAQAKGMQDPLDKQHLYEALAGVQDPALARRMLEIAFGDGPPAGTGPSLALSLANHHPDLIWDLALPHLQDPKLPLQNDTRWRLAIYIAGKSALPERETALRAYEAAHVPESARRPFAGALASIRQNRRIAQHAVPEIAHWISTQSHN